MADEQLNSIVNVEKTSKQINDLVAGLDVIIARMEKIIELSAKTGVDIKGATKLKELTDNTEKHNAVEKEAIRLAQQKEKLEVQIISLQSEEAKRIAALNEQKRVLAEKNKLEAQTNAQLVGAYKALLATQQQNKNELKDLAAAGKQASDRYKELVSQVQAADQKIKGIDKTVGEHQKNVGNYSSALDKVKGAWVGIMAAWTGAMAAGAGIISFVKKSVEGALEDERAAKRLTFALDGNTAAMQRMIRFKDRLMESTLFSEDEIMATINMGLELGKTEVQTRKMVETAMGLARVTGQDLNAAMIQLAGTYEGDIGRLGKLSGELKNLTKEQLKNGEGIDVLNEKYGKFASEGMQSIQGQVLQAKKWWGETMDDLGFKFITFAQGIVTGWKVISAVMGGGISDKQLATQKAENTKSKQLRDHQDVMDMLNAQIDANLKTLKALSDPKRKKAQDDNIEGNNKEAQSIDKLVKGSIQYIEQLKIIAALHGIDLLPDEVGISKMPSLLSNVTGKPPAKMTKIGIGTVNNTDEPMSEAELLTAKMREDWIERLEITRDFVGQISNLISTIYSNQILEIDEAAARDEQEKQRELKAAGDNKKKQDEINEKYRQKEEERERARKKALHDEAVYNKLIAATQVAINTAVAAMSAAKESIVSAIAIIALGAIELAAVLAQNIPSYFKGRKGGPAELAKVHPGELIVSNGVATMTPNKESLAYLPAGADVIPASQVKEMAGRFATNSIGRTKNEVTVNVNDRYGKEMLDEMRKKKSEPKIIELKDRVIYQEGNYRQVSMR